MSPKRRDAIRTRHSRESGNPATLNSKVTATDLPEGWKLTTFRSICCPTKQWKPASEPRESFHYIDVSAVSRERCEIEQSQLVEASAAPSRARKIIRTGDCLFATVRPRLLRIAYVEPEHDNQIASTAFCVLRPDPNKAVARFIYFLLRCEFIVDAIATNESGASYPAVSDSNVLDCEISLPSIPEQQKIAALLWKLQRAIATQDKLIKATGDLKHSAMQHLFTHGLRGQARKDTEIGSMPESWSLKSIGRLGQVITGSTPKTAQPAYYNDGQLHFIAPGDMGDVTEIRSTAKKITEAGMQVSRALPAGSTCVVCIGSSIGKVGITMQERSTTNQQINSVVPLSDYDPRYVCYLLQFFSDLIASRAAPSPVPILSKSQFSAIELPTSNDIEEQHAIAAAIATIDRKLAHHRTKRAALDALFQTTLHKLMTAQIRIADIDTTEVTAPAAQGEAA